MIKVKRVKKFAASSVKIERLKMYPDEKNPTSYQDRIDTQYQMRDYYKSILEKH